MIINFIIHKEYIEITYNKNNLSKNFTFPIFLFDTHNKKFINQIEYILFTIILNVIKKKNILRILLIGQKVKKK